MAGVGPEMLLLASNYTDATNLTGPSNSTITPDNMICDGCIDRKYVIILAGALAGTVLASLITFCLYRKRAKRKEREASAISIDISRPKPK
jgi:hypothetical protein